MSTNIRKAAPQDAKILSDLCRDVQTLHAQHHADIFKMPQSANFAVPFFEREGFQKFNHRFWRRK